MGPGTLTYGGGEEGSVKVGGGREEEESDMGWMDERRKEGVGR